MNRGRLLIALAIALALAGVGASAFALATWPASAQRSAEAGGEPAVVVAPEPAAAPTLGASAPVRLQIPAIAVDGALLTVGLNPDGTLQVPPLDSPLAAWYEHSPTPGERGPAILVGHVDSARTGPGVFHDLPALQPGDRITVGRADGSSATFAVERVERYPKAAFPTAEVYGDIDHAGLRLITCGGAFDRGSGHYLDNVVVYAVATGSAA